MGRPAPPAGTRSEPGEKAGVSSARRALRRLRALLILMLVALALTWVVAGVLSWTIDPRRGMTSAGELWRSPATYATLQRWDARASTYVEATWERGYKRPWGPEQATGSPDTHGQGDIQTAWASSTPDGQPEWLTLRWSRPIDATHISIYQTCNPGAIDRIGVSVGDGPLEIIWTAADHPGAAADPVLVAPVGGGASRRIDRVTLYINSPGVPGWNEIDAVCIKETTGAAAPADIAEASTSYADRNPGGSGAPRVPRWCTLDEPSAAMASGGVIYDRRSMGAFGWPFPAWVAMQSMGSYQTPKGPGPGRMIGTVVTTSAPMRAIPYRPIVSGVLINGAAYLLVLLVLRLVLVAPLRPARRLMRIQRGHCPRCGYDIRFNFASGCSECGFLREE